MHGPPVYINSVIVGEQAKQLRVPTYMLNTRQGKDVYTRIFIDCGADIIAVFNIVGTAAPCQLFEQVCSLSFQSIVSPSNRIRFT